MKMIRLKAEYQNKRITSEGVDYDFRFLTQERLQRVYDNNPHLRHMFEEVETIPQLDITPEVFENLIKEVVKSPKRTKKK